MKRLLTSSLIVLSTLVFFSQAVLSQTEGRNNNASFALDFQTTTDDSQTVTAVNATPQFFQVEVNGQTETRFTATLVLTGAVDLTGVNCDLVFDNAVLQVVDIHEARGDKNFDGRANIADILTLAQRLNQSTVLANGYSYFNLVNTGGSENIIDSLDIDALKPFINERNLFWTSNSNHDLTVIRESIEIFESPDVSNANGKIDDIVVTLLPRVKPVPAGFGFDGDARIADITFRVVGAIPAGGTIIRFEDQMAIDEATQISTTQIVGASVPQAADITINP